MLVIGAPEEVETFPRPAVFLGGAITGAPLWQPRAVELLRPAFATCFNPRRADGFLSPDHPDHLQHYREQVAWEHRCILAADVVLFWLPREALAITTRFEIGWLYGLHVGSGGAAAKAFAVGIEAGVQGGTYYRVLLPQIGVPIHATLHETCTHAARLVG